MLKFCDFIQVIKVVICGKYKNGHRAPILEQTLQTLISWSLGTGRQGSAVVADRILFSELFSVYISD